MRHSRGRHSQHYAYSAKPGCYFTAPRPRKSGIFGGQIYQAHTWQCLLETTPRNILLFLLHQAMASIHAFFCLTYTSTPTKGSFVDVNLSSSDFSVVGHVRFLKTLPSLILSNSKLFGNISATTRPLIAVAL